MASKAERLKNLYDGRWDESVQREFFVWNELNGMLNPYGFIVLFTGVGSGAAVYLPDNYSNPLNAFDFTVFDRRWRPVAFIEVTGLRKKKYMIKGKGRCVGAWKVWKAERFNVTGKVWYVHVIDEQDESRYITYRDIKKYGRLTTLPEGPGYEGTYYCCTKGWKKKDALKEWILARVSK